VIRIAGEDNVGIGTDFTQTKTTRSFEYLCPSTPRKTEWRVTVRSASIVNPAGMRTIGDFPQFSAASSAGLAGSELSAKYGREFVAPLAEVWFSKRL